MSNKSVTPIKTLGDRVNFAPNDKDEKKIVWLCNNSNQGTQGISDTMRKAINLYYYAQKSGKYQDLLDEMMEEYE